LNKKSFSILMILFCVLAFLISKKSRFIVQSTPPPVSQQKPKVLTAPVQNSPPNQSHRVLEKSGSTSLIKTSETPNKKDHSALLTDNLDKISELEEKIESFFSEVPRLDHLDISDSAAVHDVPAMVKKAGAMLGEMREVFGSRPWPPNAEIDFYLRCSQEESFFSSIKAVCAARVSKIYHDRTGRHISPEIFDALTAELKDEF
jgi:hypothetical protein